MSQKIRSQGRTQFPRYTWGRGYAPCVPPVFPLLSPCPCMERRREESLSDAVDRFKRPFVWTKMDTAIRGSPEEEIPDSRRRYLGRSVTGHVSSSRRQREGGEREVQGWQALDRMEIRRNNGSTSFLPSYRQ